MNTEIVIKRIDSDSFELFSKKVKRDFHIQRESTTTAIEWILDEFDSRIKTQKESHVNTDVYPSFELAILEVFLRVEDYIHHPELLA